MAMPTPPSSSSPSPTPTRTQRQHRLLSLGHLQLLVPLLAPFALLLLSPPVHGDDSFCPAACLSSAHYCFNSEGGKGKDMAANPNPKTNQCDRCLPGFSGISCAACSTNAGCINHGTAKTCSHSAAFHDENEAFLSCSVQDIDYIGLLTDDREDVGSTLQMKWSKPTGWNRNDKDGSMEFELFRIEQASSDQPYYFNFFHCRASRCSMTETLRHNGYGAVHKRFLHLAELSADSDSGSGVQLSRNTTSGLFSSDPLAARGWVIAGLMVATSLVLCSAGFFSNSGARRRNIVLYSSTALALQLAGLISSNMLDMRTQLKAEEIAHQTNGTYVEVDYHCEVASCACSTGDPNNRPEEWTPKCEGNMFDHTIQSIKGNVHVMCDNTTSDPTIREAFGGDSPCIFSSGDISEPIMLQCTASQCIADQSEADLLFEGQEASPLFLYLSFGLVVAIVVAVAVHYAVTMRRSSKLMAEWRKKYLAMGEAETSAAAPLFALEDLAGDSDGEGGGVGLHSDEHRQASPALSPARGAGAAVSNSSISANSSSANSIRLGTRYLSYHIGDGVDAKRILNKITLEIPPGESLAIMGPSGAGKTTFLDLLAAREKSGVVTGDILVNGEPVSGRLTDMYKDVIGYVSQQDTLIASLTVFESVLYSARLRLPAGMPDDVKKAKAEHVIAELGLSSCRDSRIGGSRQRGISGGEKRRVSIAMELVANPRILFLDEPTSGLDSYNALVVMQTIAKLKRATCTTQYQGFFNYRTAIVFSIHQPSSEIFSTFDNLMLLSKGSLLYCGRATQALETFGRLGYRAPEGTSNPSDFLLKIASTLSPDERSVLAGAAMAAMSSRLRQNVGAGVAAGGGGGGGGGQFLRDLSDEDESENGEGDALVTMNEALDIDVPYTGSRAHAPPRVSVTPLPLQQAADSRKYYVNFYQELGIVGKRGFRSLIGNYHLVMCHVVVTLALGALLLLFYSRQPLTLPGILNRAGCLSFTMLLLGFSSMSALDLFLSEREVYVSERNNRYYGSLSYFLTKIVFDIIPLRVVPPLFLGAITYNQMGLRTDNPVHFMWFLVVLLLFNIITAAVSFISAMVVPSFGTGVLVASLMLLLFFSVDPLMVQGQTLSPYIGWVRFVSPFFLAFEVMMVNELHGQDCTFAPTSASGKPSDQPIPIPCEQYISNLGLRIDRFSFDVSMLLMWAGVYLALAWIGLAFLVKDRR